MNKNENEVRTSYGEPTYQHNFIISDSTINELRYNLINIFPEYKKEKIEIKELAWKKGNNTTMIWFKEKNGVWIAVDNVTWGKNTKF